MPVFKHFMAFELARRAKAFLRLDAGLVRGEVPDLEQQLKAQALRLRETQSRVERQARQIERLRERLSRRDRRTGASHPLRGPESAATGREDAVKRIVEDFHRLYYESGTWQNTFWMGVPAWKCPFDLWIYQEMIFEKRPDVIIETGTAFGGSALFMACVCDLVGNGKVLTIDIEDRQARPHHERIEYLHGSSTAEEVTEQVRRKVADGSEALVILDSDHSRDHVLDELRIYSRFVREGGYLIVEDTNVNGHPVLPDYGPGPMEAIENFLTESGDFAVDGAKEKFYMTYNPKGYLKRIR
jgi:cephalosporin hydroxylase